MAWLEFRSTQPVMMDGWNFEAGYLLGWSGWSGLHESASEKTIRSSVSSNHWHHPSSAHSIISFFFVHEHEWSSLQMCNRHPHRFRHYRSSFIDDHQHRSKHRHRPPAFELCRPIILRKFTRYGLTQVIITTAPAQDHCYSDQLIV